MIYDCFQFFNELDILRLRMEILSPLVDYFVISEATTTFSGLPKPMHYLENKQLFEKFNEKVIHVSVEDTPEGDTHVRDTFQKNAVGRGLANAKDGDIVIFSDLDEIPNPDKISEILKDFDEGKIYHFAQRLFYCYLNLEEVTGKLLAYGGEFEGVQKKKWIGTRMCSLKLLREKDIRLGELRFPERKEIGIRVDNGGWHFSYAGGNQQDVSRRIADKVRSAAHTEYDDEKILKRAYRRLQAGLDPFGRDARFERVDIDESFPSYIREHQQELAPLILPPVNSLKQSLLRTQIRMQERMYDVSLNAKRTVKKLLGTYVEDETA